MRFVERAGHPGLEPGIAGFEDRRAPGLSDHHSAGPSLLCRPTRGTCVGMAAPATKRRPTEGITIRHARGCDAPGDGRCRCRPAYQAQVFSPRDRRTIRKSFKSLSEARAWRADAKATLPSAVSSASSCVTCHQSASNSVTLIANRACGRCMGGPNLGSEETSSAPEFPRFVRSEPPPHQAPRALVAVTASAWWSRAARELRRLSMTLEARWRFLTLRHRGSRPQAS